MLVLLFIALALSIPHEQPKTATMDDNTASQVPARQAVWIGNRSDALVEASMSTRLGRQRFPKDVMEQIGPALPGVAGIAYAVEGDRQQRQ